MSVTNKLNIALELLKEASTLVTDEECKTQIDFELQKLTEFLIDCNLTEFEGSEELAFSILLQCIQVCVAKMGVEYFKNPADLMKVLPGFNNISDEVQSVIPFSLQVRKDEVIDMLNNMMAEDYSSDVVRSLNINTFMKVFNLNLIPDESSSSSEGKK